MATAVLREIGQWFEDQIYGPLRDADDPRSAIDRMCRAVMDYFWSGRRICLVGAFALDNVRDRFAIQVKDYFTAWQTALATALARAGCGPDLSRLLAEETVVVIQGALVLARALDDAQVFSRSVKATQAKLAAAIDSEVPCVLNCPPL